MKELDSCEASLIVEAMFRETVPIAVDDGTTEEVELLAGKKNELAKDCFKILAFVGLAAEEKFSLLLVAFDGSF